MVPLTGALAAHCATGFSPKIAGSPEAMMGFPKFASSPVFQLEGLLLLISKLHSGILTNMASWIHLQVWFVGGGGWNH